MSTSEDECKQNIMTFHKKSSKTETDMYDYCATWFEGEWSNWQIYCSKPGQEQILIQISRVLI